MAEESLEKIHELAKERFKEIQEYEGSERDNMEDDKAFSLGENNAQWDEDDARSRESSSRSFLTIMRSNQFTDHIKNQQRQNKPSIKISPTDEGAQEEAARLRQGLIRHIQYESKASQARQIAFDDAVDEGRGHWVVRTEWVEGTMNQKIVIDPIQDSRSVYMDWRRKRPDYSDCEYGFIVTSVNRKVFEKENPKVTVDQWNDDRSDFWATEKDIRVAEYYCQKKRKRRLIQVEKNGQYRILYEDELETDIKKLNIVDERDVEEPYWVWYKMTGSEIYDKKELPFSEIPIITSIGKENYVKSQWSCKGLIRDIKAPLRLYNFVSSNEADIISKAPRAPWVGVEGQFEGHKFEFENSNTSDIAFLEYKDVPLRGGGVAPPPQRAQYSVDLSNIVQQKATIIEDIKAITGIYDASVGNRSNETSGVAIRAREAQGNNANYHFIDNYAMAINHEGRVINSALNIIYDTERTVTIMGEDDEEKLQVINSSEDDGLGEGNFNTTVSVGPSFNTQREEQAAGMLELLNAVPLAQNVASDLVVRVQDWSGKDALADRLEFAIDKQFPGITKQTSQKDKITEAALLQQQLVQCQQQLQEAQMQSQQLQQALEKSNADKNAAEAAKAQNDMKRVEIEAGRLQLENKKIEGDLKLKAKELANSLLQQDMESETNLNINKSKLEVEIMKILSSSEQAKLTLEKKVG